MSSSDPSVSTHGSFSPEARTAAAEEIRRAGGNEVFFFGTLEEGIVTRVEAVARGNAEAVPAFLERAGDHQVLIHNHPGGDLTPSPADLSVASEAGVRGLGFFIVDNEVSRVYRVVEPFEVEKAEPLDLDEIAAVFSPGGLLAQRIPGFEDRPGQRELAVEVARSFEEGEIVAFEAGTGVGKSFAYLVPAIQWAVRNRSRVVVSTQTIALGEQLVRKDLPQLQRVLGEEFRFCLVKGRGNYACRRKTLEVRHQPDLFADDNEEANWIDEILRALSDTGDGSLSDLPHVPPPDVWSDFESTTDQSLKTRCPHYRDCFYYEARRRAARAHIVVVNHHLFFADLALRRISGSYSGELVLPGYRRAIFDEAHRLEDVASQHLGVRLSRAGVLQTLGRMAGAPRRRKKETGRLPLVARTLREVGGGPALEQLEYELIPAVQDARDTVDACFDRILEDIRAAREAEVEIRTEEGLLRVGEKPGDLPVELIEEPLLRLKEELEELKRLVRSGWNLAQEEPFPPRDRYEGLLNEYRTAVRQLEATVHGIEAFLSPGRGTLPWLEIREGKRPHVGLHLAPIRVDGILAESVYAPAESVVMTSATLSVRGKWDFLGDRLGWFLAETGRFRGREFASPFDFTEQARIYLPTDLPPPTHDRFVEPFARCVLSTSLAVGGRTFVLFTSHQMLRRVARLVRGELEDRGHPVLVQGEIPSTEALDRFRRAGNAVLFGNQAFWEGVDVPGEALSCVILARLPFCVPSHPLERGRAEELEERGENPFIRLSVPQAVLSLKQGFGRLIRSLGDRGVVVIADSRIRTRPYGRIFLESLPPAPRREVPTSEIPAEVETFLSQEFRDRGQETRTRA